MKDQLFAGVKIFSSRSTVARFALSSSELWYRMPIVLTMASLAGRPVSRLTFIFQSKPRGSITGDTALPIIARYDSSGLAPLSVLSAGKYSRAHIMTEAARMTVEIFLR